MNEQLRPKVKCNITLLKRGTGRVEILRRNEVSPGEVIWDARVIKGRFLQGYGSSVYRKAGEYICFRSESVVSWEIK